MMPTGCPPGRPPLARLQAAAFVAFPQAVSALLASGAPVDARSGGMAAMQRCLHKHRHGSDRCGRRPRDYCSHPAGRSTALHLAAAALTRRGGCPACTELLLAAGTDVHARDSAGRTALEVAALVKRCRDTALALCRGGADFLAPPIRAARLAVTSTAEWIEAPPDGACLLTHLRHETTSSIVPYVVSLIIERPPPQRAEQPEQQRQPHRRRWQQQQNGRRQPRSRTHQRAARHGCNPSSARPATWLASLDQQRLEEVVLAAADAGGGAALPWLLPVLAPLPPALSHSALLTAAGRWLDQDWEAEATAALLEHCGGELACCEAISDQELQALMAHLLGTAHRKSQSGTAGVRAALAALLAARPLPLTLQCLFSALSWAAYIPRPFPCPMYGLYYTDDPSCEPPYWQQREAEGREVLALLLARCSALPYTDRGREEQPVDLRERCHGHCPYAWLASRQVVGEPDLRRRSSEYGQVGRLGIYCLMSIFVGAGGSRWLQPAAWQVQLTASALPLAQPRLPLLAAPGSSIHPTLFI